MEPRGKSEWLLTVDFLGKSSVCWIVSPSRAGRPKMNVPCNTCLAVQSLVKRRAKIRTPHAFLMFDQNFVVA